jgi:hypothetical protein
MERDLAVLEGRSERCPDPAKGGIVLGALAGSGGERKYLAVVDANQARSS